MSRCGTARGLTCYSLFIKPPLLFQTSGPHTVNPLYISILLLPLVVFPFELGPEGTQSLVNLNKDQG